MAETGSVIGRVASVQGEAMAKGSDGNLRQIKVGDPVFEGELIQSPPGGHVELSFNDGTAYFVRDKEAVTLDSRVFGGSATQDLGEVVGKIASVEGQAFAKSPNGALRQLKTGDPVFEGEVIQTPPGGRVELAFSDGTAYFLRDKEAVTLDGMVFGWRTTEARDAVLMPQRGELEDISRAIAEGNSLDKLLEETAAGRPVVGAVQESHSFVQLLRIAEAVPSLEFEFGNRDGVRQEDIVGGAAEETGDTAGRSGGRAVAEEPPTSVVVGVPSGPVDDTPTAAATATR